MAVDVITPHRRVTVADLRLRREEIRRIGAAHGIDNIRVFGSVARGEADENSDLDLLVDVSSGRGFFDMAGFALGVEDLMRVFTQVATENGLKPRIRERVLAEAIPL